MNYLVRSGLIGGAIGGEAMVLLVLINTLLLRTFAASGSGSTRPFFPALWSIAYPLLVILVFEISGIFSSWLCRDHALTRKEALLPGIITGIMISIILEIMLIANILSLASRAAERVPGLLGQFNSLVVVLLLLILVVMGSILSGFGSFIFSTRSSPV